MKSNINPKTDPAIGVIFAKQCEMARTALGWTREDLAKAAGVSVPSVKVYERPDGVKTAGMTAALRTAFEDHGIRFVIEPAEFGVMLKAD